MSRRKSRRKQSKRKQLKRVRKTKRAKSKTRKLRGGVSVEDLSRRQLQRIAKKYDVPGNLKSTEIITILHYNGITDIDEEEMREINSILDTKSTTPASLSTAAASSSHVSRHDYEVPADIMDALFENYLTDVAGIIEVGTAVRRSGRERGKDALQRQEEENDRLIALVDDKKKEAVKQKLEKALAKGTITRGEDGMIVILDDDAYKGKMGRKFVWIRKSDGLPPGFTKEELEDKQQRLLQGLRDKVVLGDTEYDPNYDLSNKVNTAIRGYSDQRPVGTLQKMTRQEFVEKITHEIAHTALEEGDTRFVDQPNQHIWPAALNAIIQSTIDKLLIMRNIKFRKDS